MSQNANNILLFSKQVYKLEPRAYDIQVQQSVFQKHFDLALDLDVCETIVM